ncbi:hypothetical protein [Conexibacter sp. DBS9H8]|uniref:hypothetical protein n=1 Tax=Conexibacter sp. DBS9H8 TaxID=2937801 RepID=UPI0020107263|nr:hypothetical protein [Conexibacter sp. DBS9H8]
MSIIDRPTDAADRAPSRWLPDRPGSPVRTYRGKNLEQLLPRIRRELGENAVILREREGLIGGVGGFFATRFIEVQARAGGPAVDLYDADDDAAPASLPSGGDDGGLPLELPRLSGLALAPAPPVLPSLPSLPGLPAPSDFSSRLDQAVQAWAASAVEPEATPEVAPAVAVVEGGPVAVDVVVEAPLPAVDIRVDATPRSAESAIEPTAPAAEPRLDPTPTVIPAADGGSRRASAARPRGARRSTVRHRLEPFGVDRVAAQAVHTELTALGTSSAFAAALIEAAGAHGAAAPGGLRGAVRQELARRLPPAPVLPSGGGAIAFVGAGGSGKTVAVAALADAYRRHSTLPVSVASLDAPATARRLGELLAGDGIPLTRIGAGGRGAVARAEAAAAARVAREREDGVVIIDTPSVSPADPEAVGALAARLAAIAPDAVYLTLGAHLGGAAAARLLAGLGGLAPTGLLISHADESDQFGVGIELAASSGLPIAYLTAAADHRRALIGTDPAALAQLLLS